MSIDLDDPSVIDRFAAKVADRVASMLISRGNQRDDDCVRGTHAIARFLGISTDTLRRRFKDTTKPRIPICGTEEYTHKGQIRLRPICKEAALRAFRSNPDSQLPNRSNQ